MTYSWQCKARDRLSRLVCGEELGIVESGRLFIRVGLVVEAGPEGVRVTCPASYLHHRVWKSRDCAKLDGEPPSEAGRIGEPRAELMARR